MAQAVNTLLVSLYTHKIDMVLRMDKNHQAPQSKMYLNSCLLKTSEC